MKFEKCHDIHQFFDILPADWLIDIQPVWHKYAATTTCYIISNNAKVIAGGLVFSTCSPDMLYAKEDAEFWFNKGYLYVAYLFVIPDFRGKQLGRFWFTELRKLHPNAKFFLTIEDLTLHDFYIKNNFKPIKSLYNTGLEEIMYIDN